MKISRILGIAVPMSMLLMSSCASRDRITYFQNPEPVVEVIAEQPIRVQPGDKLIIVVKSKDAAVSDLFNLPIYTNRVGAQGASINATGATSQLYRVSQSEGVTAYNVTPQGTIDFPFLGDIKVEGMTRAELGAYIKGELVGRDLVKDPTVSVEFLNTGVNVLGAVTSPGRYEINTDNYTILDAIAVAGDLVLQGRRDNVKVVREEEGKMHVYTVDLTDLNKTMNSPVYYLRQNDVVYVAPSEELKRSANVNGNNIFSVSFWMSFASLLTTAATTVGVFVKK